jgi:TPR repeat protein
MSEAGAGVPQNDQTARSWFQKAADLGNADAMGNLGAMFERGRGGAQSLDTAREWYVRGAKLGGRVAMYNFGVMLENGRGTSSNLPEAVGWYRRAAELGHPPALNDLGRLYLAGAGVPKNYLLAKSAFEQAAHLGKADAMNNLGMLYLKGAGVQRDIKLAKSWFEKAISLGNAEARDNLKYLQESAPRDGVEVAARRATCAQTCTELHRSYVMSICERFSVEIDGEQPERTKCIGTSLSMAQQCRDTCREWAPSSQAENKCLACFRALTACSSSQEPPAGEGRDQPYEGYAKACLAAFADCNAGCSGQKARTASPRVTKQKAN